MKYGYSKYEITVTTFKCVLKLDWAPLSIYDLYVNYSWIKRCSYFLYYFEEFAFLKRIYKGGGGGVLFQEKRPNLLLWITYNVVWISSFYRCHVWDMFCSSEIKQRFAEIEWVFTFLKVMKRVQDFQDQRYYHQTQFLKGNKMWTPLWKYHTCLFTTYESKHFFGYKLVVDLFTFRGKTLI